MSTHEITVDGQCLSYGQWGPADAPAMVFIHGWTGQHITFDQQIAAFCNDYRCLAPDLPGHGASGAPTSPFTLPRIAHMLIGFCDALALETPILVGHSMGSLLAIEMNAQQPGRFGPVVLLDPAMIIPDERVVRSMRRSQQAMHEGRLQDVLSVFRQKLLFDPTDPDWVRTRAAEGTAKVDEAVAVAAWDAMLDWDGRDALAKSTGPMLYLAADRPQNRLEDLREIKPDLRWGQTVGAGHEHHQIVPDQVNAMIRRFLEIVG